MTEQLPADDLVTTGAQYSTGVVEEPMWLPKTSAMDTMARWWRNVALAFEGNPLKSFNWDDRQVVPLPGDQAPTQACICYASCLAAAALYRIKTNKAIYLAPRVLHLCTMGLSPDEGTRSDKMAAAAIQFGLPYIVDAAEARQAATMASRAQCSRFDATPRLKVISITRFHSHEEAKAALRSTGPIVVHMNLTDHFRDHYVANSIYITPPGATTLTSHAVCAIGYDDTKECWICVNTFGPNWGGTEDGRFMLKYGECGVLAPGAASYRLDIQV